jgi:hypothetical protein
VRESGRIFAVPTYLFVLGMLALIGTGFIKMIFGEMPLAESAGWTVTPEPGHVGLTGLALALLAMRAFSSGCAYLVVIAIREHDHGLSLDPAHRLAFVACDANATLLTVDLDRGKILDTHRVGDDPDVLAYDPAAGRLYVAAESGWVTILDAHDRRLNVAGRSHLAEGAHVVAVDPGTHRSFYPVPHGAAGRPALLIYEPTR